MEQRQLGPSDVRITPIVLGTWAVGGWMWGGTEDAAALRAIEAAIDAGVTAIDTAPIYGFGHAEELVGQVIAGKREQVQILTKFGLRWDGAKGEEFFDTKGPDGRALKVYRVAARESVIAECERSLRRLGIDVIDLYQCHWRDHTTPVEETMDALSKLLKDGKIRAGGVSNFTAEEIDACRKVFPLASDQPQYSLLSRDIEADIVPLCREHNIGILAYSPLELGLLTGTVSAARKFPSDDLRSGSPLFSPANRRKVNDFLDQIRPIAEAHDATLTQLVINWTIHRPGITAALVGARRPDHAKENAAAASFELSEEETARIDPLLDALKLQR